MAMSRDRVRFLMGPRYFLRSRGARSNGMDRARALDVMANAFGVRADEANALFEAHPDGFLVVCRPSQFARFIVLRHDAMLGTGGVNGVNDLEPELFVPAGPRDGFERVVEMTGMTRDQVRELMHALVLTCREVEERLEDETRPRRRATIDVSDRPNTHRAREEN